MMPVEELVIVGLESHSALDNMRIDLDLLASCEREPHRAYIRFYTWRPPALSLGRFESADVVDSSKALSRGIEVVRRPTGGRVVLHLEDLTYTVVMPRRGAESVTATYNWLSGCLVEGLRALGAKVDVSRGSASRLAGAKPCFLSAARHEIVSSGRKLVGSAQRLGRRALLQHGSIPVGRGYLEVVEYMACSDEERAGLRREMLEGTICLEDVLGGKTDLKVIEAALAAAFGRAFEAAGTVRLIASCDGS
jgi:lipoate-protein ligase A